MSNVVVNESVYEWRAPLSAQLKTRERLTLLGLLGLGTAGMVWGLASAATGIAGDARFTIVVGAMLVALGCFGVMHSRQLRSTMIRIDRMGTLSVASSSQTASIDLRTVSGLSIRHRSGRPQWQWSIEAVHPGGAWHAELAGLATYWNLDEQTIAALDADLQQWLAWATGAPTGAADPTAAGSDGEAAAPGVQEWSEPIAVRGMTTSTRGTFEWKPPENPNKVRNRRRLRIGVIGFALLIAVIAVASEAKNGIGAALLSMFVPVLILLIGFGVDRAYDFGKRFRIVADGAGLTIRRSSKPPTVIPADAMQSLRITLSEEVGHEVGLEGSNWYLTVITAAGETVRTALPLSLGSSFSRNDAIALEAELCRRLGVANQ